MESGSRLTTCRDKLRRNDILLFEMYPMSHATSARSTRPASEPRGDDEQSVRAGLPKTAISPDQTRPDDGRPGVEPTGVDGPIADGASRLKRNDIRCEGEEDCRHVFLATASAQLAASLDPQTTLKTIARLAVPTLADWAAVDIVTEDDELRRIAAVNADPDRVELVRSIERLQPDHEEPTHGARLAIRTGMTDFVPEVTEEILQQVAVNERHLEALRKIDPRSFISAPLISGDRVLGAITLVYSSSGRKYSEEDRQLVEDLAGRAATALDNAWVVRELKDARGRLEKQTAELESRASLVVIFL